MNKSIQIKINSAFIWTLKSVILFSKLGGKTILALLLKGYFAEYITYNRKFEEIALFHKIINENYGFNKKNSSFHSSTQTTLPEHNKPHLSREITKKKKKLDDLYFHHSCCATHRQDQSLLPCFSCLFLSQSHRHSKP
jgi:hypothetical protein